jgi:transcriptional regulator with XRE-family HTH domain
MLEESVMLAEQFGRLVKAERDHRGLKQADLARSAKVSRSVLSRLERSQGLPVQTDVLDRLFAALEMKPRVSDAASPDAARIQARLEQQRRLEQRRSRHLRLAVELAAAKRPDARMIAKARERVELWRSKRSCSPLYIERWSEILALPPRGMAKAMVSLGEWEDAMFQNSPWSWAWG